MLQKSDHFFKNYKRGKMKAKYDHLSSQLRSEELTSPLDLPAPGRRQSVYIVLLLRTDLCFC